MLFTIIASYLPYTLVTAYTPGPNNIVALYAVSQKGWRKGRDILFGIGAGFLCVMLLCALFCYELAKYAPSLTAILKYIGAAYITYLAVHVAISRPQMLFHAVILAAIGISGNLAWAAAGSIFQKLLKKYYLPFNLTMAAILLWCALTLAFNL